MNQESCPNLKIAENWELPGAVCRAHGFTISVNRDGRVSTPKGCPFLENGDVGNHCNVLTWTCELVGVKAALEYNPNGLYPKAPERSIYSPQS